MSRRTGKPSYQLSTSDTRRQRVLRLAAVVAAVGLAAALLGGAIGYTAGRPDGTESTIADIRKADAQRDSQQIVELTATARRLREQIQPILTAIQADPSASRPASAEQARQWQQTLVQAAAPFANPPSGTTATNVARTALRSAVEQASLAVDAHLLALTGPPAQRAALVDLAKRQAAQASAAWSVAATQLDQINVDSGQGHQHVYLEGDSHDGAEEGSGG
ncbi:hypothetical protein JNW91_05170 [Micromonospora sp. STR1_7]|uniref:DUF4439 domain-containing protein n=1 Tax=Micromonospora parastrephiae TaxID=2806101 RepID=A0ABS1XPZ0_9ACTN|nr:hypothetical protein [Micromonospora parastrephiae]MBM0231313.1 hypothetical protein [Micromonospora parastrephiae]